ncbi:hypothetical protein [Desulforegula conservatrix]|uniref:hypothetical protein n=1 Tax=Desulforegula conservatrix TaxID=153026 RepID=UPI00041E5B70|nr:hypothetical protein [Desulforegula conservatrix]
MQTETSEMIQARINGLKSRIAEARRTEAAFIKIAGIDQNIIDQEIGRKEAEKVLELKKADLEKALADRKAASEVAITEFSKMMNDILPLGTVQIDFDANNKGLDILLINGGIPTRYAALSGGEKVMMNMAITRACGANVILVEAAEMDDATLTKAMVAMNSVESLQAFIFTCHTPAESNGFKVISREAENA